jgi:selenide,water dikinase
VLVGFSTADDAGVVRLREDLAIVQTVDFFTPIVDDPYDFGRIAAANALSDVYAMGGEPVSALNLVAFPLDRLGAEVLGEILRGGQDVATAAGCAIVGGHSIDDPEPKYGLAVTGAVHPAEVLTNAGGRAGDVLVLTKPLGTGILTTALKRDALLETGLSEAVRSMTTLNDGAARAAAAVGVSAATDITGFGLLGHLGHMVAASRVGAEIALDSLPLLDHARNLAARGIVPGGTNRNLQAAASVEWEDEISPVDRILCVDAQTSGGLLLAVPPENEASLLDALRAEATPAAVTIGRLTAEPGRIRVLRSL